MSRSTRSARARPRCASGAACRRPSTAPASRPDFTETETFARGKAQQPTIAGNSVATYVRGNPPLLVAAARGIWNNTSSAGALTKIKISGNVTNPVVNAFGRCTPTACNWGRVRGITYGPSISTTRGATLLAPYTFGFKKAQLVITYTRTAKKIERLTVSEYNEFTDGSGRSNYTVKETLERA